ncbi:MAG: HD domain-containing protein [Clostridia bacterium]|nr:HD domain-containing protein [Clostridia bacterium]
MSETNKIINFFTGTPSYNNDKDYADYAFYSAPLNMFFLACLLLHSAYLVIFSLFKAPLMLMMDGICVVLYTTFVILLRHFKGSWLPCTLVTAFELFIHQICAVTLFGLSAGFQYLLIPLMFMSVFIRKKGAIYRYLRIIIILLASCTFIFLAVYYNDYKPQYSLPYEYNTILLIMNCIISFLVTAVFTSRVIHSLDAKRSQLDTSVNQKTDEIENMQNQIIISFANIIEARDGSTGKHVKRTSEYVEALVKELHRNGDFQDILDERYMHDVMLSAPLHDIGKITIPDAILTKAGRLTQNEFEIIKKHTINGKEIIEQSMSDIENENFLKVAKSVALYHHECWDGSGYPYGIKGDEIPLCARIMTIADYFDALVAKRSYKAALPTSVVFDNIEEQRGKKFDPVVTDAFLRIRDQIDEIAKANAD